KPGEGPASALAQAMASVPRASLVAADAMAPMGPRLLTVTPWQAWTREAQEGAAGITPGQAPLSWMVTAAGTEPSQTGAGAGAVCPTVGAGAAVWGAAELSGPAAQAARKSVANIQGVRRMGGNWS